MVYKRWSEDSPEGMALGVEFREYVYAYPGAEPWGIIGKILPDFEGEEFSSEGYQTPHYVSVWDVLEGKESLKYIKSWPEAARIEAGRFLRSVWRARRSLKERGLLV